MEPFNRKVSKLRDPGVSLDAAVQEAISQFLGIPSEQILTQPNVDKYFDPERPNAANDDLREVFAVMRDLNLLGVENDNLCVSETGGISFAKALHSIVEDLAATVEDSLHYVELGPEPVKTGAILQDLTEADIEVRSYTAIDINPASEPVMRDCVSRFLPPERIRQITADYFSLDRLDIADNRAPALVTMLGFQEGNEMPGTMMNFFRRIMRPGDLLLAEIQVLPKANWLPIFEFYGSDLMRRFSKIGLRRALGELESEYGVVLVPVPMEIPVRGFVAVTTERIVSEDKMNDKIFVTNYCIKYADEEFRMLRELDGAFRVVAQRLTGDRSVSFQLAERR